MSARLLAVLATCYHLHGTMADGSPVPSFNHGNPRILAASDEDLDAGRVAFGDRVCVQFPGGDRIAYTVRDRCPGCQAGQVDLLVASTERARKVGRIAVVVTMGACR